MAEVSARDAKLIQYLNEAFGTEKRLETALQAHIAMTTRAPYKKRLQQHLQETKRHAREVERRIKKLGGTAETASLPGPEAVTEVAQRAQTAAQKAAALAQGPVHMMRGTGEQEILLKNARTEYQSEAEEIAHYTAIRALADKVGDKETAQLARAILREEERMAGFLQRLIPQLTNAVAVAEIPASERDGGRRRRTRRRRSPARRGAARRGAASRRRGAASSRRASSGTRQSSSAGRTQSTRARSGGTRSGSSRSGSSARRRTSGAGSSASRRTGGARRRRSGGSRS
jgi:ferritin-like metal-binding protein YciE